MGTEVAPEYMLEQGGFYPPTADYYGYYHTANELPGEWDDQHSFFGSDGQDAHYSVLQTENLPYLYYTPSYGYAQSSYNPYNPYIPGAVVDFGSQQYVTGPYQQAASSPAYIPVVVQSSSDVIPYSIHNPSDPSYFSTVAPVSVSPDYVGPTYTPSLASAVRVPAPLKIVSRNPSSEISKPSSKQLKNIPKDSQETVLPTQSRKQSSVNGVVLPEFLPQANQSRNSSLQAASQFSLPRAPSIHNSSKVKLSGKNDFTSYTPSFPRASNEDRLDTKLQPKWFLNNGTRRSYLPGEENRGPRARRGRSQWTSITAKAYAKKHDGCDSHDNIIIVPDQFNRDDFPLEYPNAKFFVIKSYNEDDVHKSIKYNVWSSTSNGNKKLNAAYEEAQRISRGRPGQCPVFLFFSVNSSGHFCGVAEMVGHVDFQKDMDFWQQDKWTGSFPVKWHIVKDVPNSSFRHIILENNENRPVTHSRDTQELTFVPGLNMLEVFKIAPLKESIFDDFMYYEEREKLMYQERMRLPRRTNASPVFVPTYVPLRSLTESIIHPVPLNEKDSNLIQNEFTGVDVAKQIGSENLEIHRKQSEGCLTRPPKGNGNQMMEAPNKHRERDVNGSKITVCQPSSVKPIDQSTDAEGKSPDDIVSMARENQLDIVVNQPSEVEKRQSQIQANHNLPSSKVEDSRLTCIALQPHERGNSNVNRAPSLDASTVDDNKDSEPSPSTTCNIVTIGSVQIEVNGTQTSPATFSVGFNSVDSRKKV